MKNFVQQGDVLTVTASAGGVMSGDLIVAATSPVLYPIGTAIKAWPRGLTGSRLWRPAIRRCHGARPGHVKETDLTRALRAARKAGADVERVEIGRDGRIVLVLKNGDEVSTEGNEWDEWRTSS
jgi:hypothetical protein